VPDLLSLLVSKGINHDRIVTLYVTIVKRQCRTECTYSPHLALLSYRHTGEDTLRKWRKDEVDVPATLSVKACGLPQQDVPNREHTHRPFRRTFSEYETRRCSVQGSLNQHALGTEFGPSREAGVLTVVSIAAQGILNTWRSGRPNLEIGSEDVFTRVWKQGTFHLESRPR
jgi:hypothetical protein